MLTLQRACGRWNMYVVCDLCVCCVCARRREAVPVPVPRLQQALRAFREPQDPQARPHWYDYYGLFTILNLFTHSSFTSINP